MRCCHAAVAGGEGSTGATGSAAREHAFELQHFTLSWMFMLLRRFFPPCITCRTVLSNLVHLSTMSRVVRTILICGSTALQVILQQEHLMRRRATKFRVQVRLFDILEGILRLDNAAAACGRTLWNEELLSLQTLSCGGLMQGRLSSSASVQ